MDFPRFGYGSRGMVNRLSSFLPPIRRSAAITVGNSCLTPAMGCVINEGEMQQFYPALAGIAKSAPVRSVIEGCVMQHRIFLERA